MADFKDLARQYVESDNKAHQNSFAQKAAEREFGTLDDPCCAPLSLTH